MSLVAVAEADIALQVLIAPVHLIRIDVHIVSAPFAEKSLNGAVGLASVNSASETMP